MARAAGGDKRGSRKGARWANLTDEEVLSIVVNLIVRGVKLSDVVSHMQNVYGEESFNKAHPYLYLRRAAERGMLEFVPTNARNLLLEGLIRKKYPGLKTVEVVNTAVVSDIADHAAKALVEQLQRKAETGQEDVRLGLMGGGTIMAVCRALASALARMEESVKERWPRLTFQALVVGDNVREPLEDPASFFTYFADVALNPLRRDYVSLHAPVFGGPGALAVESAEFRQLREEARSCDILLISAGTLADEHSFLGALQFSAREVWQQLNEQHCRGDLGRLPVSQEGPMPLDLFTHPPCTLVQLSDLQAMVGEGRSVMVVAAPCGDCRAHKGDIIQTLLDVHKRGTSLLSDLVVDSLSARKMALLS